MHKQRHSHSALTFVLKALIPYSRQNMMLAFKPNQFFNELEKISGHNQTTLKHAYWRGQKLGLIEVNDKVSRLTKKGLAEVKPFTAKRLGPDSSLMVIFDIPEEESSKRHGFRRLLKSLEFEQVQKSVWSSQYDHRDTLKDAIEELGLSECVEVYESLRLLPK